MVELGRIPSEPGCYLFRDSKGKVIYVGKAKDLKKRVGSYSSRLPKDQKTRQLVELINSVDFISTQNEVEALILENNLIKKHSPKYNINLKDSRRYAYIEVTDESFPRVLLARQRTGDGSFFGPFVSARERDMVIETINNKFMLRTCRKFPKKPCLRFHIGHCTAPCAGKISEQEYAELVGRASEILKGRTAELAGLLEKEMKEKSARLEFETAQVLKSQLWSLKALQERQSMERQKKYDEDIVNYSVLGEKTFLMLFNVHDGMLLNKQEFEFDSYDDAFEDFLVEYYSSNKVPKEIIVPEETGEALTGYLEKKRGAKVSVVVPKHGEKRRLLDLVKKNIELSFFAGKGRAEALQKALSLPMLPEVIECFDISHLGGTLSVGSMVQFRDGLPDKRNYRRFRLREAGQSDDFAAIAEVVRRRYERLTKEKKELPSLIVIDGGLGQLNSALGELKKLCLDIPTIAIAKEFEEIYEPNSALPMRLDRKDSALHLLQALRDEAHRFAISYNRLLRKKKMKE